MRAAISNASSLRVWGLSGTVPSAKGGAAGVDSDFRRPILHNATFHEGKSEPRVGEVKKYRGCSYQNAVEANLRRLVTPLCFASVGSGTLGVLLHIAIGQMEHRVVPSLDALPWLFAIAAWFPLPLMMAWLARRRPLPMRRAALALLAQVLLAGGASYAVIATEPGFPFAPTYLGKIRLPNGGGNAYLYEIGIGCSYDIFVDRSDALSLEFSKHVRRTTCTPRSRDARPVWNAGRGEVGVVDEDGRPIP